jgi:uncharacterized protein (DUF342 family)
VIVHQGITGKNSGAVRAGRSLWARFIENSFIESGNMVVVSDGIINSQVDADKSITCQGKRGSIVGGRLRALEEINAKSIGSPTSGTETICETGIDPRSKHQLEILIKNKEEMEKKLEELQRNIQTLINIKKQRKALPEAKEMQLQELTNERRFLMEDLQKNKEESIRIQEILAAIRIRGKISASNKVFSGVKILVRDALLEVRTEYKASTFIYENGLIKVVPYEASDAEAQKVPEGYAAD